MISIGETLTILESVDSTNNYAMAQLRQGRAGHGDAFFAKAQWQGKGQRGRSWMTEPGSNIILTLILRPPSPGLSQQFPFSMAIALACHDFFSKLAGSETSIKWPNDIYWRDRKAGGVLIESIVGSPESGVDSPPSSVGSYKSESDGPETGANSQPAEAVWKWAIVGIGININQVQFDETVGRPVSLRQITGREWPVLDLVHDLFNAIQRRYDQLLEKEDVLAHYNERLLLRNQKARFRTGSRVFEAIVNGVNAEGDLQLQTSMEEYFPFGSIEWLL